MWESVSHQLMKVWDTETLTLIFIIVCEHGTCKDAARTRPGRTVTFAEAGFWYFTGTPLHAKRHYKNTPAHEARHEKNCFLWAFCHLYESQVSLQQVFYWSVCVCTGCVPAVTHSGVCMSFAFLLQHRDLDLQQLQHNMGSKQAQKHNNTPIRHTINPCSRCAVLFTCSLHLQISWWRVDVFDMYRFSVFTAFVSLWPNLRLNI